MKMIKSHANVVSFDENVSYLSTQKHIRTTLMNLYDWNEQFLMNKTAIENRTNIGTII